MSLMRAPSPMVHDLKCWGEFFEEVASGRKPFEFRKYDRPYRVGDVLLLREFSVRDSDGLRELTGRECRKVVTYVLTAEQAGRFANAGSGWVVMGLADATGDSV